MYWLGENYNKVQAAAHSISLMEEMKILWVS